MNKGAKNCSNSDNTQEKRADSIASARRQAEKMIKNARQEAIERCFLKAKEKLISLPQYDYEEFLANLIVKNYRPGYDEIMFNIRDKNRLSLIRFIVLLNNKFKSMGKIVPLIKISSKTIDTEGGFVLKNGDNKIDCTVETLLKSKAEILTPPLSEILFNEKTGE